MLVAIRSSISDRYLAHRHALPFFFSSTLDLRVAIVVLPSSIPPRYPGICSLVFLNKFDLVALVRSPRGTNPHTVKILRSLTAEFQPCENYLRRLNAAPERAAAIQVLALHSFLQLFAPNIRVLAMG